MVYRDSGAGMLWPMLTKSNYHEWSLLMKVKMQAQQLCEAVDVGGVSYNDNRRALEALCTVVPSESATTKYAARRCSDSARSGKGSPSTPVSKSRTLPSASPI